MKKIFYVVIFLCIGLIYCSDESSSKKPAVKTAPSKVEFEISSFNSHSISITYPIVGDLNPDPTIEAYIGLEDQISLSENTENIITVNNFLEKLEIPYDDSINESSQGDVYKFSALRFLENYKIIVIATNSEGSVHSQASQRTYYIEDFEDNDLSLKQAIKDNFKYLFIPELINLYR